MLHGMPSTTLLSFAKTFSRCMSQLSRIEVTRTVFADGSAVVNRAVCGSDPPCAHDECAHAWYLHAAVQGQTLWLKKGNEKTLPAEKKEKETHMI